LAELVETGPIRALMCSLLGYISPKAGNFQLVELKLSRTEIPSVKAGKCLSRARDKL
jgi:hypothetical protein